MKQSLQIFNPLRSLFWSVAFLLLLVPSNVLGQTTVSYTAMTTITFPATPVATIAPAVSGLTFSQISRGSGVLTGAAAGSISGSGFNGSLATNISTNKWYTFSITSNASTTFSVSALSIVSRVSTAVGGNNVSVQYSIGGSTPTNVIGSYIPTGSAATYAITPGTPIAVGAGQVLNIYIIPNLLSASGTTCRVENNTSITVSTGSPASISGAATASAFTTTYGSPSSFQSFSVSGSNLTANLVATAPTGFEVSSDAGVTYGNTASFTQTSGSAGGTLRIRLKATAPVSGTYNSQNIVLSSTGATSVNITTSSTGNIVSPANLTITANPQTVSFGDSVASVLAAGSYTSSGFVNGENSSVISGSVSYITTYTDTTPALTSGVTISPVVTLLTASNYLFTPANGTITIAASPIPVITSALTFNAVYGTVASAYTIVATNAPTSYSATPLPTGLAFNSSTGQITGTPTALPGLYNITISASNSGGSSTNQTLAYTITPKPLTVSGAVADNKIYDRTTVATISGSTLVGIYGSDVVTVSNTGTFLSSLVANGITVTSTQTLSGADAGKYSLTVPTGLTANITPKSLTISGAAAQNKVFDGTTTATITGTLSGVISPDVVTLTLNGAFASSAIGNGIAVTSTSTIGGANAGNYSLTQPTGLTANITQAIVPLLQWNTFGNTGNETTQATSSFNVNMTSSSLNYTGSTVAPAGNGNRFGGTWGTVPSLTSNKYIQFTATPAPGYMFTPTSFTFIWDLSGTGPTSVALRSSADNYTSDLGVITGLTSSTTLFRTITISGLTGLSSATTFRLYGYNSTGGTGGFDCASSQNNVVLNGYTEVAPPPAISAVNNLAALSTVYGTASATSTFNVSGTFMQAGILVTPPAGYEVSLASGSGFASTITVGAAGTIASTLVYVRLKANATVITSPYLGNIVLSSSNATPVDVATVSSTVTPKTLTVSGLSAINKVYDGNTSATLSGTGSLVGVINSDVVSLDGTPVGTFASADVANGIAVTVTGYSVSGAGSGNYTLTQPTLSANITSVPSPLISSALTASATYGVAATTYSIIASESPSSYNATGLPAGLSIDTLTGEITGTPTGLPGVFPVTISATNAGGTGTATLNYTILAKELTITGATANSKVYNKLAATTLSGSVLVGIVGTDVVSVSNTANFTSVNVGTAISVTSTQTLSGADANKYSLTLPTGLSADITAKALTISGAVAQNKQFDGTTVATITGTLVTVESGDVVTLNGTGIFASSAIANGIAVTSTSTISGANANNYTLTQPIGLVANITPVTLLQWNTFGNAGTETSEPSVFNNVNVTAANLTQGTITPAANPNRFGGSAWFNTGNTVAGSTLAEAIAGNDYIQFVVTPNSGYTFTATSFSFLWDFSATGPKSVALRSSADGFTTNLGTLTNLTASTSVFRTISISSLVKVSTPTTFRLYGFGGTNTGGTAGFDTGSNQNNVILYGTTALLTGPTASVLSGTTSICDGDSASISVAITDGVGPFTVVYTDGTNNFTETGYTSGANIIVSPSSSPVTYQLVSVTDSNALAGTGNSGSAVITTLPNVVYYQDADSDGYGDVNVSFSSCTALAGFVTNATDCDDTNASIYRSALLYADADADGYNVGSAITCYGATLPIGTSLTTLGSDCDDTNAAIFATFPFYVDTDNDTYGTGSSVSVCAINATTPPTGYSVNNTDCNDANASIYRSALLYTDVDNDGYNAGSAVTCYGATLPVGTSLSTLGSDCNDNNALVHATFSFYTDADGDGFGSVSATAQLLCAVNATTAPVAGVSPYNTDCDDTKSSIRPNAVDVCYDAIDNDCNGNVDNVGLPGGCIPKVANLQSASCGSTVSAFNTIVSASNVPGAQAFRFKITNMTTNVVQVLDSPTISFQFMNLPGVTFATQYKVEVAIRFAGVWQGFYGTPCFVNTPSPVSVVSSAQCGSTLTSMSQYINSSFVSNVTGYRYEVTNQTNGQTQYVFSSINRFTLTQLLASNQTFATNYFVRVACRNTDGTYLPEGPGCIVKSPAFPTTQVISSLCNNYLVPSMATNITVDAVAGATLYKFRLFNGTYDFVVESVYNKFSLSMFPGLELGTLYSVQAAAQVGGIFDTDELGAQKWGKTCTLTTPNAARQIETVASTPRLEVVVNDEFTALAYPNPFAANFKLNVTTNSEENLTVRVYDMLGKLVEDRKVNASDVETLEVGANYPSGVYNVIVSQGENTKTLRVIKR